jgi:acetolactate synthase-1/2/3 large subunit
MHHEQAAAFAADAFGRTTGIPGIALATSGPGATNLLTGIGSCYFDSSPGIFITGQVNTKEQKGGRKIRQLGFQETDIFEIAKPITKAIYKVENAKDIPNILELAFAIASSGRPGPVLIDIPMNIQRENILNNIPDTQSDNVMIDLKSQKNIELLIGGIKKAKRPLILAGRGIRAASAVTEFRAFVNTVKIPVVLTLLGLDLLPYEHLKRVGFIGSYGNRWANILLGECDFLIVLGSRLDIRQTGANVESFRKGKKIFHIDCEEEEINNRIMGCVAIRAHIKIVLKTLLKKIQGTPFKIDNIWIERISHLKLKYPDTKELMNIDGINPNKFIHELSQKAKNVKGFVADVGNNQMWTAQSIELTQQQIFITSGGMGAMGFALPASIGLVHALNNMPVVVVAGDGGFQVNIQELQTVIQHNLPIKIVILNNNCLGMIRQFQDSYFENRHQSTHWGYSAPNFEMVAKAYGIDAMSIKDYKEVVKALDWLFTDLSKPQLLQVYIDLQTNAYPKLAFGKPITEMEPFSKPLDMEGT